MTTVFIKNIHPLVPTEEVRSTIAEVVGGGEYIGYVGEFKASFGGNQMISVKIEKKKADTLLEQKKLRIGLNWCPVWEKKEINRCYRYWGLGHLRKDCKEEEDKSMLCRKCGGRDHKEKQCKERAKCLNCKEEGHRAGTTGCPEYRKALQRLRLLERRKREGKGRGAPSAAAPELL